MTSSDYSVDFYREHAQHYAYVSREFLQSVYVKSSHPGLKNDWDAWERLKELAPGKRGLDAGCGAGARDVFYLWSEGYDMVGVDAVEENIQVARELHTYWNLGIDEFILSGFPHVEECHRVAEQVLPLLRERISGAAVS